MVSRAAASPSRWRMPREKPRTRSSATSVSPTCSSTSSIPAVGASGPRRAASAARFPRAVSAGYSPGPSTKPGDTVGRRQRASDRRAQDLKAAAVGDGQAQQKAEQRGLPRAVRPDDAMDLPGCDIQVDAVERDDITEALRDPASPHRQAVARDAFDLHTGNPQGCNYRAL